jgi:hypothetical protein
MKALIRHVFILMLLLCVIMAAIIGATYRDTNRFAYLFTNPDGSRCKRPCILGVTPGKHLLYVDANKILQSHPAVSFKTEPDELSLAQNGKFSNMNASLFIHNDNEFTWSISMTIWDDSLSIGELLNYVGRPLNVELVKTPWGNPYSLKMNIGVADNMQYDVGIDMYPDDLFGMSAKVIWLTLHASPFEIKATWTGFATYDAYFNRRKQ